LLSIDYEALAKKHITRPAETKRMPNFLIYARNKKGKTTFSLSGGIDKTLILDPEDGTDEMKAKNPHVWKVSRWEDLDDCCNYLRYGDHPYLWTSVDGLTRFSNLALKYVMRLQEEKSLDRIPGMVQLKDYGKAGELMKDFLTRLHAIPNVGVIFTAQERMMETADAEEDEDAEASDAMFVPDLPKGVRGYANSIVDVIGRLYVVKNDEGKPERRLWIGESLKYDTGYRSDFVLPDYMRNPTAPKLTRLIRTGKESASPAKA